MTQTRPTWPGLALAAAGSIAFSGKAIIVKLAYRHGVDAVTLIMYRMLFALPLFAGLAWWAGRGRPPLTARDLAVVSGLGFCGYYLSSFLDFAGLQYITASLERLVLYLNPTLVLALGLLMYGRRVRRGQLVALAVSYAGVLLVFGHELTLVGDQTWLGAALVFGSAISYAVYLSFSGNEVARLGALRLSGWASAVACLLCIAQFLVLRPLAAAAVAPAVLWLSVLNATLCTVAPVLMVMMAVERIGPTLTAQTGMIGPLATIAMGVLILHEPLNAWIGAGTLLVLTGIWLLVNGPAPEAPLAPGPAGGNASGPAKPIPRRLPGMVWWHRRRGVRWHFNDDKEWPQWTWAFKASGRWCAPPAKGWARAARGRWRSRA